MAQGEMMMATDLDALPRLENLMLTGVALNSLGTIPGPAGLKHWTVVQARGRVLSLETTAERSLQSLVCLDSEVAELVLGDAFCEHYPLLEVIDLSGSRIVEVPEGLFALPKLQYLSLEGNPLSEQSRRALEALRKERPEVRVLY